MPGANLDSLLADLREHDFGRYLCAQFAPPPVRPGLYAVLAFALEAARVPARVNEPMMGQVRLAWWAGALDDIYAGRPPRHPVAQALAGANARGRLSREHLDALLDAHHARLVEAAPESQAEQEQRAAATGAAPLLLWLEALGVADAAAATAARHAGIAWSLAAEPDSSAREAAATHIGAARALRAQVPREALPALLVATLAERRIRRGDAVDTGRVGLQLLLLRKALFGRY